MGEKMKKIVFLSLIVFIMLFGSCSNEIGNYKNNEISVRVNIKSEISKDVDFKVYLENDSGQIINGALVLAKSESGITTVLDFDNDIQCYSGSINGLEDDVYIISVKSNLLKKIYTLEVPHVRLTKKPLIKTISDSDGNSVLSGETLKASKQIQVSWESLGDDVSYQVIVRNALNVKWTASTKACNAIIPENYLTEGTYYLYINAQKNFGDVYYETDPYYSISNISSATVSFCLE